MKKLFSAICLMLSLSAMASTQYKKGEPFTIKGSVTHFYGGPKSAEANMWERALHVCHELSEGENNGLILNRLSEVMFSEESNASSNASAIFVCVPSGFGE